MQIIEIIEILKKNRKNRSEKKLNFFLKKIQARIAKRSLSLCRADGQSVPTATRSVPRMYCADVEVPAAILAMTMAWRPLAP
jgi:hypothetical protein